MANSALNIWVKSGLLAAASELRKRGERCRLRFKRAGDTANLYREPSAWFDAVCVEAAKVFELRAAELQIASPAESGADVRPSEASGVRLSATDTVNPSLPSREEIAADVIDGYSGGNLQWETADETRRMHALMAADVILARLRSYNGRII